MREGMRHYRDAGDMDDQLDVIRVLPRERAMELYAMCLDYAYTQGKKDGVDQCREVMARALPGVASAIAERLTDTVRRMGEQTLKRLQERGEKYGKGSGGTSTNE